MAKDKRVYSFGGGEAEGSAELKRILGGKGSSLHEMTRMGIPVPPGFTISAELCAYYHDHDGSYPEGLQEEIKEHLERLEKRQDRTLGATERPLLVSVRSGASVSMPGMMDTVLNIGLNSDTVLALARESGKPRFAWDSYRRLISMFGEVVMGIEYDVFEGILSDLKSEVGAREDTDLSTEDLKRLVARYLDAYQEVTKDAFPQDPHDQLDLAIRAVFESWNNERAIAYRKHRNVTETLGTAVTVQAMVYGNMGRNSGTGVAFTRNPSTGENEFYGDFLWDAQGEDVVAGIRTPKRITELEELLPDVYRQLLEIKVNLENHYRDMQDIEFTVQEGQLYMLQTRTGQRAGPAACKIAVEMVDEGLITTDQAVTRVSPEQLRQLLYPRFESEAKDQAVQEERLLSKGLNAGPGAASGRIVFSAGDAAFASREGEQVILVRKETSPDDIEGMVAAEGILTATGGLTSHAAVVARGMGKCCVVGCSDLTVDVKRKELRIGDKVLHEFDWLSLDGSTGEVFQGTIPTRPSEVDRVVQGELPAAESPLYQVFEQILEWAHEIEGAQQVRANADTPQDARIARRFGADGIGLCRTEHMFFGEDRLNLVREMILASDEEGRKRALEGLLPMQRGDFLSIFDVMDGLPVTVRLLDPPLHEFLPQSVRSQEDLAERLGVPREIISERVSQLEESNPMLGHRGCRLGITHPDLYRTQIVALVEAACQASAQGIEVLPEVMVPLTGSEREMIILRDQIERTAREVMEREGVTIELKIGTMLEIPRACLVADRIARWSDFFSFGTNDLTQLTYGFSRDDYDSFLGEYDRLGILERDPFETIDVDGVGRLMQIAAEGARKQKPEIKVGICGEHGGEPDSIDFCHQLGFDYVSCSPWRVAIARLAAAQAALGC